MSALREMPFVGSLKKASFGGVLSSGAFHMTPFEMYYTFRRCPFGDSLEKASFGGALSSGAFHKSPFETYLSYESCRM